MAAAEVDGRIYVIGGHDGEAPVKTLEGFDPDPSGQTRGEWGALPGMLARRAYVASAVFGKQIFAIGGSADGRTLNTIEVFDTEKNEWIHWFKMPPMQTKRTLHAASVGGKQLFVCGGFDGTRDLTTVECYDPAANAWSWKTRMTAGRSYLAVCGVGNKIYAIGGQDRAKDSGPRAHDTVEVFDLYSERWSPAPPLLLGRLGLSATSVTAEDGDELIYVCGGSDGSEMLNGVEFFNVRTQTWTEAPPMRAARLGHATVAFNKKLYVIGGFDGKLPLDTFECLDFQTNEWMPLQKIGCMPEQAMSLANSQANTPHGSRIVDSHFSQPAEG